MLGRSFESCAKRVRSAGVQAYAAVSHACSCTEIMIPESAGRPALRPTACDVITASVDSAESRQGSFQKLIAVPWVTIETDIQSRRFDWPVALRRSHSSSVRLRVLGIPQAWPAEGAQGSAAGPTGWRRTKSAPTAWRNGKLAPLALPLASRIRSFVLEVRSPRKSDSSRFRAASASGTSCTCAELTESVSQTNAVVQYGRVQPSALAGSSYTGDVVIVQIPSMEYRQRNLSGLQRPFTSSSFQGPGLLNLWLFFAWKATGSTRSVAIDHLGDKGSGGH
jgi:hypothetical protein